MIDGTFRMPKKALDADFLHDRPATLYQALVDLWRWANDRERAIVLNGQRVELKRGQLARSQSSLAQSWNRDREWVKAALARFQSEGQITFRSTPLTTLITVLDYEVYNPDTAPSFEDDSGGDSEGSASSVSRNESSNGSRNLSGSGSRNESRNKSSTEGEEEEEDLGRGTRAGAPPPENSGIPSEEDIALFAGSFEDLARGVPKGIPEVWWRGWYGHMMEGQKSFRNWRTTMRQKFLADFMDPSSPGNRKARTLIQGTGGRGQESGTTGQKNGGGQSVAQAVYQVDVELNRVRAELDTCFAMATEVPAGLRERERALQKKRAELVG